MTLNPIGTVLRSTPRAVAASIALSIAVFLVAPCAAAPFEGTGTLVSDATSYGSPVGLFWDGGRAYRLDRIDGFALWDRVRVQGELLDDSITVTSIVAAGPFQECGRLETEELCPTILYCGKYDSRYVIDSFGGFAVGDSVLVTMLMEVDPSYGPCTGWPKWVVSSVSVCGSATAVPQLTWGTVRWGFR